MIPLEELGQRLALLEGDNCQQRIAREREIQSGVGSSMPVTILLPGGGRHWLAARPSAQGRREPGRTGGTAIREPLPARG